MQKAIEILQTEELMLETESEINSDALRLAIKYGKKSEVEDLRHESDLIWARFMMVRKLIQKLQAEGVKA